MISRWLSEGCTDEDAAEYFNVIYQSAIVDERSNDGDNLALRRYTREIHC
jgi:hypothetical protein